MSNYIINEDIKQNLIEKVSKNKNLLVDLCSRLVQIPSESPKSDTREIAAEIAGFLEKIDDVEVSFHTMEEPITNLVARVKGNSPGKRLIFNGHVDTYPVGDESLWTESPFSGHEKNGRIYGRGVSDMKGGIASYLLTFKIMAEMRDSWSGELVLTLAGDEETMGVKGTKHLLDTVPHAVGDAMISGDVGTAKVLRFGEKGLMWIELEATGKASHGAHVHKGENAIDRLVEGIDRLNKELGSLQVHAPKEVTKSIEASSEESERYSGEGETEVLQQVTVNFGLIEGGVSPNLIPAKASAQGDIRLPIGVEVEEVNRKIKEIVDSIEGLSYHIFRQYEPNWSDINHEIFAYTAENVKYITGEEPVNTIRVGASDARHYRISKDVPAVNCGLNAYNLGGPDEYIEVEELINLAKIQTLTAYDYLTVKGD